MEIIESHLSVRLSVTLIVGISDGLD